MSKLGLPCLVHGSARRPGCGGRRRRRRARCRRCRRGRTRGSGTRRWCRGRFGAGVDAVAGGEDQLPGGAVDRGPRAVAAAAALADEDAAVDGVGGRFGLATARKLALARGSPRRATVSRRLAARRRRRGRAGGRSRIRAGVQSWRPVPLRRARAEWRWRRRVRRRRRPAEQATAPRARRSAASASRDARLGPVRAPRHRREDSGRDRGRRWRRDPGWVSRPGG